MNEFGQKVSIKDRMPTAEYNNFAACQNALIHSYEEGKRLRSTVFDQKGRSLVDFKRATDLSEIVKKNGIAYHELDEMLRRAIEYFGLQPFFGAEVGSSSFDVGKTEIVVPGGIEEIDEHNKKKSPSNLGTGLFGKVKKYFVSK